MTSNTHTARRLAALALLSLPALAAAQPDLASGFANPPAQARPHTWWHWMNGNITKEGITADLEAMKQIGLGGAQIFNVSESIPAGPILYNSPEWRALFKHAATEAGRLGIELCMHNCAGWSSSGGPWITPEHAMQKVTSSVIKVTGPKHISEALPAPDTVAGYYQDIAILAYPTPASDAARIKDIGPKAGFDSRYNQQPDLAPAPADSVISKSKTIDLTSKVKNGKLDWDCPDGSWTILRIGHTPTGAKCAPAPESGRGLECDKLSRSGLDAHWAGGLAPLMKDLGPLAGKVLNNCLIDSYEMGGQNWTPEFLAEFKKRRGYDALLFLPVITGRTVENAEASERFLWDFRRTIGDLFADNYYSYFAELCHKQGIKASIEPYDGPFECMLSGRDADIPMGEFWVGGGESSSCKLAASVAHAYGRPVVGAESFTAEPNVGRWLNHPYSLKSVGDLMYTVGINRYIIHRYAHQPWTNPNVLPGMTMGQWGTHFERTTTWWTQGTAWVQYLTRCQYLLQQGNFVADVCFFTGDAAPADAPHRPDLKAKGYDYDAINPDVLFSRITVKDGRLTLPTGLSYSVMVLPDTTFMLPRTLTRIRELISQGATVIGPRPTKSPSLQDFPACDSTIAKLADEVWAGADGKATKEHKLGKGRIIVGESPESVLAASGTAPDCQFARSSGRMAWIHRRAGDADIYFVSSQTPRSQDVECTFRISGKAPELWRADTGETSAAPIYSESNGLTTIPIHFDPSGSTFVIFRKPAASHLLSLTAPEGVAPRKMPKIEIKKAVYEAKDGTGSVDVTSKVAGLVAAGDSSIPASNGLFGDPTYNHVKQLKVDYTLDGKPASAAADENQSVVLFDPQGPEQPIGYRLVSGSKDVQLIAFKGGAFEVASKDAKKKLDIPQVSSPVEVQGPWKVQFPPNLGAPSNITLDHLGSWTANSDPGVKYFSGTAEYTADLTIPPELLGPGKVLDLDLGTVHEIAEVTLNDKPLGIWWKPPFRVDITSIAVPGKNSLKVRITNLWTNRLIGDEQLPEDVEWNGKPIKKWPDWFINHQPRPSKDRITFTTWHHYTKDSKPIDSGLIGPVLLRPGVSVPLPEAP